jgi:hypothetical protein
MLSGPPEHNSLFPLGRQNTSTISDRQRGPCDALIYFLRFLGFLRNGLNVKTSDGISWLDQAKDAPAQSKSSNRLPSSAPINGITKLFDKPYYYGEETLCAGGSCKSSPESESRVCPPSRLMQLRKKRNKSKKEPVWRSSTGASGLPR